MTGGPPGAASLRLTVTATASAAIALMLGLAVAGQRRGTAFDAAVETTVDHALGGSWFARVLVAPTEPWAVLAVLVTAAAALGVARRRPEVVVLCLVGPAVAVALNTWVLKPAFGRYYDDHLAYPSGHTVSLVAAVTVVALSVRTVRARVLTVAVGALGTVGAAVGMAALDYHHVTDVVGGAATAVAIVSVVALVVRPRARSAATRRREPAP